MALIEKSLLPVDQETIVAHATAQGAGAIALIRLSGHTALTVANAMSKLADGKSIFSVPTHTIHYGTVVDTRQKVIDHVLFFVMKAPKTFTGQDTVEISCHNNQFIVEAIIARAIACGARLAGNGEFTKRAVIYGKIDLMQAEAVNELIHANNQQMLKYSLQQLQGSLSAWVVEIEEILIKAIAFCEASFEFIDEELSFDADIGTYVQIVTDKINFIKQNFNQQQHTRSGIRIAIIGPVNAGKSSLFNNILSQNRAIVTSMPGTTRDALEAGVYRNGVYWTLIDTAGIRTTDDIIEQKGIEKSYEQAHAADIILLVCDPLLASDHPEITAFYQKIVELYTKKIILIQTKQDMYTTPTSWAQEIAQNFSLKSILLVSNTTNHNIKNIESAIEKKIKTVMTKQESPFLLNQRHFNILLSLEQKLSHVIILLAEKEIPYELVSYHLHDTLLSIDELTGKNISEKGMDAVFREFCVGK